MLLRRWMVLALMLTLSAHSAWAQFSKPETAVQYRQAALFLMANHMQRIKAELDFSKPNLEAIRAAFGEAGKACKACHDDYRRKK